MRAGADRRDDLQHPLVGLGEPVLEGEEASPWALRVARWSDHSAMARWLERDPATHLFALSWLESHGLQTTSSTAVDFQWWIAHEARPGYAFGNPVISGVCLVLGSRMAVPAADHLEIAAAFGRRVGQLGPALEHIMGERGAVEQFWRCYEPAREARLIRQQGLYALKAPALRSFGKAPLRLARVEDLEAVVEASAAMYREETLSDPFGEKPGAFRIMHQRRILERRTWLWPHADGRVMFKAEVSCSSSHGVQVAGVYTDPALRGQGIARRGLAVLCQKLLLRYPQVTLYVNDVNAPARRVYELLGFHRQSHYGSVFII